MDKRRESGKEEGEVIEELGRPAMQISRESKKDLVWNPNDNSEGRNRIRREKIYQEGIIESKQIKQRRYRRVS